jgi:Ca2+-transporting ATPase
VQLLWINLVTDGLPALTLGIDPAEEGIMEAGVGDRNILSLHHQRRLAIMGSVLAAATLAMLVVARYVLDLESELVQTATFTALVVGQLVYVFNVRLERSTVWRSGVGRNRWLVAAVAGSLGLHLAVVYTPFGQLLFGTAALGVTAWLWIIALSAAAFVGTSFVKPRTDQAGSESQPTESLSKPSSA